MVTLDLNGERVVIDGGRITPVDLERLILPLPDDAPDPDLRIANQLVARFGARITDYKRPPTVPGRIY